MKAINACEAGFDGSIFIQLLQTGFFYAIITAVCRQYRKLPGKGVCFAMKKDIHPEYGSITITCACGNVIETGSTRKDTKVEICSSCHPFYTGSRSRMSEKGGRIERFKRRYDRKDQ